MREVVIFDLDKTLLSGDSTKAWMLMRFKTGKVRFLCATILAPLALLLLKFNRFKATGASILFFTASFGMTEKTMKESLGSFSSDIRDGKIKNVNWFKDGLRVLLTHIEEGRRVIIVTASPEWLADEIAKAINLDVEVIGTPLSRKQFNVWAVGQHCRNKEKVRRIKIKGIETKWHSTYTDDIDDDYPILINSENPYLINSKDKKGHLVNNLQFLDWS